MNIIEQFVSSTYFKNLRETITPDTELQQVLLETQATINAFLAKVGETLVEDWVADTYMLYGEPFSTEHVKVFTVVAVLYHPATSRQNTYVFPFKFNMMDNPISPAGLYINGNTN